MGGEAAHPLRHQRRYCENKCSRETCNFGSSTKEEGTRDRDVTLAMFVVPIGRMQTGTHAAS